MFGGSITREHMGLGTIGLVNMVFDTTSGLMDLEWTSIVNLVGSVGFLVLRLPIGTKLMGINGLRTGIFGGTANTIVFDIISDTTITLIV